PYRTKFNARIKQSEVFEGADISGEVKALRRMAKYDRNKDYLDQIYYAIGNLYLSRGDTASAIENYAQAAAKSTRSGIEKAIAQITLGNLYFDRREYAKAQPCYSEAVPLLPENYPDYKLLKRRSDVLDELAVYSQNVSLQDSLLRVAALPEAEQLAIIDRQIKELKEREKKEAEERDREEYLAQQEASANHLSDQSQREYQINTDDSWYFYNSTTRNSGKTEFQRRWGSRKLEDDWRRRNKSTFNASNFDAADESEEGEEGADGGAGEEPQDQAEAEEQAAKAEAASDPHNREYYLAQLPVTEEQKALAHEVIQDGLYNMGIILKDKLDDYPAALAEFDRLLREYPDNIYRLDIYYNLYLMYMRKGEESKAERYRQLILNDFPESPYALALANPNYIEDLRQMDARQQELYEATYDAYLDNRNAEVHQAYATMMDKYPLSPIMPKFMFLDALAYATEKDTEKFNAVLRDLLDRYPDTDITPIASAWLTGMARGRQIQSQSGGNLRGMLWDIRLSADSASIAADSIAAAFELNEDAPQLLVMVYPTDSVSANALLYEVARFNFNSFVVKDFDLEAMNFGRLGMLIIRGFDNQRELNHYRSVMASSPLFRLPAGVRPIAISAKNFETLLQHGRTFEDYFRFLEEQNYVDAQADLLKAEEIETLPEAEEAEAIRQAEGIAPEAAEPEKAADLPTGSEGDDPLLLDP
ncbi:MAG: tetratricopeptide repeat protein, partial [Lachnospiraceae bacterium]|nr:tetratricopeptide repeat protein [Lachnospiraceae bacterium]